MSTCQRIRPETGENLCFLCSLISGQRAATYSSASGHSCKTLARGAFRTQIANQPRKGPISRGRFPPMFSEDFGLKPPFVSPRLDFPPKMAKWRCHKFVTSLPAPSQRKGPQKGLRLQSQAVFLFKKSDWDCSLRSFSWFMCVFQVNMFGLFGPKSALAAKMLNM